MINLTYSKRVAILVALLCTFACAASSDTVYNVRGTFQPSGSSNPYTGPLNGGTFSGTFSATLPVPSGNPVPISTFDISLFGPSSTTPLVTLSNTTSGESGSMLASTSRCAMGPSTTGPCDLFQFTNASFTNFLQLLTPVGFTGGSVTPGFYIDGTLQSVAGDGGVVPPTASLVASGSIEPAAAAEPGTFLLLGLAVVAGLWFERKRLLA